MLSENKNNYDKFDKFLKDSLRQYRPPVPSDFPKQMAGKFQQLEQQRALRKVVLQERLLKAACVLLPIAAAILALIFPDILPATANLYKNISLSAQEAVNHIIQYWQLWAIYAAAAVFVLYAAYEVLLADN